MHGISFDGIILQSFLSGLDLFVVLQVLWALAAVSKSTVQARQEAASRVITSVKTQALESNKDLFKQFAALCDQLIRLCFFQPPPKARYFECGWRTEATCLDA
jgi:hypothetical protein